MSDHNLVSALTVHFQSNSEILLIGFNTQTHQLVYANSSANNFFNSGEANLDSLSTTLNNLLLTNIVKGSTSNLTVYDTINHPDFNNYSVFSVTHNSNTLYFKIAVTNKQPILIAELTNVTAQYIEPNQITDTNLNIIKILDNAPILLILLNNQRQVKYINKAAQMHFGVDQSVITKKLIGHVVSCVNNQAHGSAVCGSGKSCNNCVLNSSTNSALLFRQAVIRSEGAINIVTENGPLSLDLLVSSIPVTLNNEFGVLLTIEDITNYKHLETELKRQLESKSKIYSIVSHDLQNQIYAINGLIDNIIRNLSKDSDARVLSALRLASEGSNQLIQLMNELLLWSKHEMGTIAPKMELVLISSLVTSVINKLKPVAEYSNVTLVHEYTEDYVVKVDDRMITNVLRNLLSNAIKYTGSGNKVIVNYAPLLTGFLQVNVIDYGSNFSDNNITDFFSDVKIIERNRLHTDQGSGFGLLICKEFVLKHSGQIKVQRVLNQNTVFSFTIPLSK